jgi:radical SAM superfamily enzyme with C-terminal helix-hairpin-helix motif
LASRRGVYNVIKKMKKHSDVINSKSRSEWEALIREWVHNEIDRKMLARYLLDGIHLEPLAEEFDLSTVQCQKRVDTAKKQLFNHI